MTIYILYSIILLIFTYIIYIAAKAINRGIEGKNQNKHFANNKDMDFNENYMKDDLKLTDEISKLNELYRSGVIDKDEFIKAKKKILDN